jgi:hypothetical protein
VSRRARAKETRGHLAMLRRGAIIKIVGLQRPRIFKWPCFRDLFKGPGCAGTEPSGRGADQKSCANETGVACRLWVIRDRFAMSAQCRLILCEVESCRFQGGAVLRFEIFLRR